MLAGRARRRVLGAAVVGVLAGLAVVAVGPWQLAVLVGFGVWAAVQLVWIAAEVHGLDGEQTRAAARREDDSRAHAFAMINHAELLHGLVSFAIATVIIGLTINVTTSFIR